VLSVSFSILSIFHLSTLSNEKNWTWLKLAVLAQLSSMLNLLEEPAVHLRCICAALCCASHAATCTACTLSFAFWASQSQMLPVSDQFCTPNITGKVKFRSQKGGISGKLIEIEVPKLSRLKHIGTIPACHTYQLQGFRKCSAAHRPWIVLNKFLHVSLNF
jgi:hypothetical protein